MTLETPATAPASEPEAKVTPEVASLETKPLPAEGQQQPPGPAEPENSHDDEQKKKPKVTFNERISQIHAQKKEAEARAASAAAERDRAYAELEKLRSLNRDQIDPAHHNRLDIHEALQVQRAQEESRRVEMAEMQALQAIRQAFEEKISDARASIPDLDSALSVFDGLPVNTAAAEIIAESDYAAQIAYYFGKNPQEARSILTQPPHRQAAAIARLEAKLAKPVPNRKTSNAPPPPSTVAGAQAAAPKSVSEMGVADIQAMLRKSGVIR